MKFLATFYLFLPAFVANATPVILTAIPFVKRINAPVWKRGFGDHKTWAGFIGGTAMAVLTSVVQFFIRDIDVVSALTILHTSLTQSIIIGLLLGLGALMGDAGKSFCKRRIGIRPGGAWPIIDGIDYIVGSVVFIAPVFMPPLIHCIGLLFIGPPLSLAANTFSYVVGWKKTWY
jgi:CDP-2,3-bis-(O-geranylgeranyl)-sn-glycerol synthase